MYPPTMEQNTLVIVGATIFFLFLVWKLRPTRDTSVTIADKKVLREARARARAADSPRAKAEALCEASDAAAALFPHAGYESAKSYLFRALRVDATWPEPLHRAKKLLWKRDPASFERLLWRVLARTPWEDPYMPVIREALTMLGALYRVRFKDRLRAQAIDRLLRRLG